MLRENQLRRNFLARLKAYFPPLENSGKQCLRQSDCGQIVVEYVLLLAIAVSIAILLTKTLIGRTEGEEGLIIKRWSELNQEISADKSDDLEEKAP